MKATSMGKARAKRNEVSEGLKFYGFLTGRVGKVLDGRAGEAMMFLRSKILDEERARVSSREVGGRRRYVSVEARPCLGDAVGRARIVWARRPSLVVSGDAVGPELFGCELVVECRSLILEADILARSG